MSALLSQTVLLAAITTASAWLQLGGTLDPRVGPSRGADRSAPSVDSPEDRVRVADPVAPASPVPPAAATEPPGGSRVVVVVGAPGEPDYGGVFARAADFWARACAQAGVNYAVVGREPAADSSDLDQLREAIERARQAEGETGPLWLVLLGHGTFDGKEAKFNLRGPDLTGAESATLLKPFRRPLVVINCASASAPFLRALAGPERVIVTATRSGYEQNYARFGQYLAEAIAAPAADLDRDGQTSVLEAFLQASRQVATFYEQAGRLATEHALLDDNGDGLGTPADWFRGLRAVKKAGDIAALDGVRAHQLHLVPSAAERELPPAVRQRRDQLERLIAALREAKPQLSEADYYQQLEPVLVELARLYEGLPAANR
ncbi:MAG: hypothetical protein FJ387_29715 [Verrucomicrobia bacterium]|nr:hypothetical protein [Verrucomicrobiota bacterium]